VVLAAPVRAAGMSEEHFECPVAASVEKDPGGRVWLHRGIAAQPTGARLSRSGRLVVAIERATAAGRREKYYPDRILTVHASNVTKPHRTAIEPLTSRRHRYEFGPLLISREAHPSNPVQRSDTCT
jgi:hypothetical protein